MHGSPSQGRGFDVTRPIRLGGFAFQVRLVLVLLVLFLATLDLMNLYLLGQARDALARSERARLQAGAARVVSRLGPLVIDAPGRALPRQVSGTELSAAARAEGFSHLAVLDRAGREAAPGGRRSVAWDRLGGAARSDLEAGRAVSTGLDPERGGEDASMGLLVPVLDGAGRLGAVLEARAHVPELGRAQDRLRLVWAVQLAGVLVILGLVLLFASWISAPYQRLAAAVGRPVLEARRREPARILTAWSWHSEPSRPSSASRKRRWGRSALPREVSAISRASPLAPDGA